MPWQRDNRDDSRGRHAVHRCGNTEQLATAGAFIR
jgi:hypothetical protein